MALKKLVAGNWKMHGLSADLAEIAAIADAARAISAGRRRAVRAGDPDRACGPGCARLRDRRQDVHHAEKGAHTGCISAEMLLDAGASLTIVGHSERRDAHRESDDRGEVRSPRRRCHAAST